MSMKKISWLSAWASGAVAVGALLIGSPGRAATEEPATAAEARAAAQESTARAEQFKLMGGSGYKTGLVQREEANAVRYQALADQIAAEEPNVTTVIVTSAADDTAVIGVVVTPPAAPATSPEAEKYAAQAAHYRLMGGAAYKTGLVQRAEAQQRRAEEAVEPVVPAPQPNPICLNDKPDVTPECGSAESTQ